MVAMRHFLCGILALWLPTVVGAAGPLPVVGADSDYDALLARVGTARIVMLGEATHGSREFYRERARITRRLLEEKEFDAVVLEAPWEPARRVDAYVRNTGRDADACQALADFLRFPRWMWRNTEVRDFVSGLRTLNHDRSPNVAPLRIFGMDFYSVPESADAVVRQVARRSVTAAALARQRYACFDDYLLEPMLYGREAEAGRKPSCADGAALQLEDMSADDLSDEDAFAAWQSARVAKNGEAYYRALYRAGESSWNLRERHMADTLTQLLDFLEKQRGRPARIAVWAHNIHQGDARATDQLEAGELSLGQLMRERYGDDVVLVGFSTHRGEVRAATGWGERERVRKLRKARTDSWTGRLRDMRPPGANNFLLMTHDAPGLDEKRLERAVGVVYLPHTEYASHYFHVRLGQQFDAVIHIDNTHAVDPLD